MTTCIAFFRDVFFRALSAVIMRLITGELRSGYNEWIPICRVEGTAEVSCNTGKGRSKREPMQSKSLAFLTTLGGSSELKLFHYLSLVELDANHH